MKGTFGLVVLKQNKTSRCSSETALTGVEVFKALEQTALPLAASCMGLLCATLHRPQIKCLLQGNQETASRLTIG